ncbi:Fic/DOC family protein [Mariniflexile fucanivorans]|uniref:Fic/DOC family protein n=1 Tax=Mariniflexile fucanivorans TaxID=264023 RepID=A0A4R1RHK2_9FLAO|nr:Fic family protein [Mariniflexile fucanivorans]TCL65409.1 Fic/DOC family protein [Mariniflexile fucanivorans]
MENILQFCSKSFIVEKNFPIHLQEIIYGSADSVISRRISKWESEGIVRKIASRLYTSNLEDSPADIIKRNIFPILGNLYSGVLLSHRSAFEFAPTASGQIFVTYKYTKKVRLPGITIRFMEGVAAIHGDTPFSGKLMVSQKERALLENLQESRQTGADSKTLAYPQIEEKLEQIIRVNGEDDLNAVRDRAREISEEIGMQKEFKKLNKIISALLSTRSASGLKSPVAAARAVGMPYDPARLQLFEMLFRELKQQEFKNREEQNTTTQAYRNFAVYESYFSNYIEGTVFEVDTAKQIIATQQPMPARNEDSHDVLGTYQLVSNKQEMSIIPYSGENLLDILQYRHEILLNVRKDKKPGKFKDRNNQAGDTSFVDMGLVRGTIIQSFDFYKALVHPFAKAAYIMFVVSEIHPFLDGNGCMARVMMNAELATSGQTKIIIPTVYREDYLGGLRRLTRNNDPKVYIRMLERAQAFSHTIYGSDMDEMEEKLRQSMAFKESNEGVLKIME